ncbi:similar to Saccharomyces cerevisiae YNL281W HCH1 Heat shock protein regulator that binds to Hsp90p and may stimulate ATPase activity [Maudiozyma barnettii]|uniref:Similar to Saccharomyces cerevisiae YNL281W HCH1 Heat shock protein regulator that binds to Hsp90p and may stimulate ATPase activity n=1 Tax=Maudiozyma barnettii TaxID=61262 RepID=A0A8H2ZIV1_9SACH|nr:Hch1p [Kazachstania barnettii]CAB4253582.1 similar to Saccharomyces cerevisiae YNL281W HCH1 Heat shock protein regulator that binds to Hsp90p and may stimulate ATPase activity [Kazachstania barnettii]CAD1781256.1 similar to Saccharomyces cerevisiae YNL281W HCH1 Heat shock protein regulator that binds to Hsp90p and may stimulate ATPase activity [Kazachstania barnettii]
MAVLNPNNWHWVDKNTLPWTKSYFDDKIKGFEVKKDSAAGSGYRIVEINKITGDSNVSQRKGKPICYFDLNIELKLEVFESSSEEEDEDEDNDLNGTVILPEFAHDDTDFEIKISGLSNDITKQVNQDFIPDLRTVLLQYQKDLLETHSQDLRES